MDTALCININEAYSQYEEWVKWGNVKAEECLQCLSEIIDKEKFESKK